MKHPLAIALLGGLILAACETPKTEKKLPASADQSPEQSAPLPPTVVADKGDCIEDNASQNVNQSEHDNPSQSKGDQSPHQSQDSDVHPLAKCQPPQVIAEQQKPSEPVQLPELAVGALVFSNLNSWLNPSTDKQGAIASHDGACMEGLTTMTAEGSMETSLKLGLQPLLLKPELASLGMSATCLAKVEVNYRPGYAFAIRKVSMVLENQINKDSMAFVETNYRAGETKAVQVTTEMDTSYDKKSMHIDHLVDDSSLAFSSCSGKDTLNLETALGMNFLPEIVSNYDPAKAEEDRRQNLIHHGDMKITGSAPVRLELVWTKCQE